MSLRTAGSIFTTELLPEWETADCAGMNGSFYLVLMQSADCSCLSVAEESLKAVFLLLSGMFNFFPQRVSFQEMKFQSDLGFGSRYSYGLYLDFGVPC